VAGWASLPKCMRQKNNPGLTGLVSIHDVMPDTLEHCQRLLAMLEAANVDTVTLLVVPGKQWSDGHLRVLRNWQDQGIHLAGHGWHHRAAPPRSLYHRLHSLLLSRLAAEHLSLDRKQIQQLIRDCHDWFARHGLTPPELYVPPAWALGDLPKSALLDLPFSCVELLDGVLDSDRGHYQRLPLSGYEADTALRAVSLGIWNRYNAWSARSRGKPLRIGIHPFDAELRLQQQMREQIGACEHFISYPALFDQPVS